MFGYSIANDARFGNARESRGLAEPCFGSRIKPNAFHVVIVLQIARKRITSRGALLENQGHRALQ